MNSLTIFGCLFISVSFLFFYTNAVPVKPVHELDTNGNSVLSIRTKRNPISAYPHRTMMLASFYRPVRHSAGSQAGGVFAHGNAVSGGSYLGATRPNYLRRGPEPIDGSEVSSAEAEAASEPQEDPTVDDEDQNNTQSGYEEETEHQWQEHVKTHSNQPNNKENELPSHSTEAPVGEEPDVPQTSVAKRPSKIPGSKKTKKTTVYVEEDDQQSDEDDDDDDEDETDNDNSPVPFVPIKANRNNNVPNLNNFFPMVFSFPKSYSRSGSSGSPPGIITAIANSYSTGKGGVASSVATAYGGSPNGKKKRNQPSHDE